MPAIVPLASQLPVASSPGREPPVFLFAYANDRSGGRRFLRNLAEERRRIKQTLQGAGDQGRCKIIECAGATLSEVLDECQRHTRSLSVLHFAGHADPASLFFETPEGHLRTVNAFAFTEFLGSIKGLRLVFLNGCSTKAHVEMLLSRGVRAVIATSSWVADDIATELAERFYKAIEAGAAIGDAFHQATGAVMATFGEEAIRGGRRSLEAFRGARDIATDDSAGAPFPWELFGEPDALAHQLMVLPYTDRTRLRIVITATIEQFDEITIAKVTAELQRVADDLSLQITRIQRGSVHLHISMSIAGARRLIESWRRGDLSVLCGFNVKFLEETTHSIGVAAELDDEVERADHVLARIMASRPPRPSGTPSIPVAWAPGLTPAPSPMPPDVTTLRSSVGVTNVRVHPGTRWFPYGLGALVIAGAMMAITIVLAAGGPPESPQAIAPPPVDAAVDAGPPVATEDLAAECRGFEVNRKWDELVQCAERLKATDPKRGEELQRRAFEEAKTAVRVSAVEAALRDRNLLQAEAELAAVWPESLQLPKLKREYEMAEAQAITELTERLERTLSPSCTEYNQLLTKERAALPPRVSALAAQQVTCTPLSPSP
jgi:hypothetical protein